MIIKKSNILFFISVLTFLQAIGARKDSNNEHSCRCKNTSIDSLEELDQKKCKIIDNLWTYGLEGWSPLAGYFKDDLQSLLLSSSEDAKSFAELTIIFMSNINPYLDRRPSGCAQASVINATISCIEDGNNTAISYEVNIGMIDSFYGFVTNYDYCNALEDLNCDSRSRNDKELCTFDPTWKCYKNGFAYDFDKIWNLRGNNIPSKVKNIVKALYLSCDFKDNYIALVATYCILDLPKRVIQEFNPLTTFELFYLQYGPAYKTCCCEERTNRLKYLRDIVTAERKAAFKKLGKYYSSPEACKHGNC